MVEKCAKLRQEMAGKLTQVDDAGVKLQQIESQIKQHEAVTQRKAR